MRFDFVKSKWFIVVISFILGSLLQPLPGKIEDIIINKYFQNSAANAVLVDKIKTTINIIVNSADRANQHTEYYRSQVCEKIYHKKYMGIPCYAGPIDGEPNKKVAGEIFLEQTRAYIDKYLYGLQELQNTLDIASSYNPSLIPILNKFNKWILATRDNCWFPRNEYYSWENIILHQLDNKLPFDAKYNYDILQSAVALGAGDFPANCFNYTTQINKGVQK